MRLIHAPIIAATLLASILAEGVTAVDTDVARTGLTKDQAKQVLMLVLRHEHFKMRKPGVFIDGDLQNEKGQPPHAGYYDFSVGYDSPKAAATEYWGLFAVSAVTGDVWELNQCKRFVFPALAQAQQYIMARTGRTLASEAPARRSLGCSID